MRRRILLFIFAGSSIASAMAQKSLSVTGTGTPPAGTIHHGHRNEPPRAIIFDPGTVTPVQFLANINTYFGIPTEFTFTEVESNTDHLGMRHRLLRQYYKGIPLEGMGYRAHEKAGFITSANGKAVREITLDINTALSEATAFQQAVQLLHTRDTTVRKGTMLVVSKNFTYTPESFVVAWQFDMDVSFAEAWRISIDARTGELVNKVSLVNSCWKALPNTATGASIETTPLLPYATGTGLTYHYGNKPIRIEQVNNNWRLQGQTEHGGLIATYNYGNASSLELELGFYDKFNDFYSSDNVFNTAYEKTAASVQWGAEQAYEYYYTKHNRNSFDDRGGAIKSYAHVGVNYNNAFWNRRVLAFGDGSNNNPLVELDVVSHELTHGVTQYEAGLQYVFESGALNESFSDIMGKAVEFHTFGNDATWQLARYYRAGGLRDFANPNAKNQPDTYKGNMWYTGYEDNGGVHYNSGVQNFWFYLLCQGGSGVNDNNLSYAVNAIGMEAAVNIAYRNLTEYLDVSSQYLDARIGSLLAAADLYGKNSAIYQEVDKAWDAVGVLDEPEMIGIEVYDVTATTVKINGSFVPRGNNPNYHFEYGTTPALGSTSPAYPSTGNVSASITGLQSQTRYYLKLVATNENGSSYLNTEFTTISLAPLVKINYAADITETTSTLHGQVNPNSLPTSFYFEYGPTPALGQVTPSFALEGATEFLNVSTPITNLQPRQNYYYTLVANNEFASVKSALAIFFSGVKPVIHTFSPLSAPTDTEVTIQGENFNSVPEKNVVGFGATRATVLSATATQIRVKVPAGASLGTLSVLDTESGLVAESVKEFVPTYTGEFKKNALAITYGTQDNIYQALIQDMDGDNKPDIVTRQSLGFGVILNVNAGGKDITESTLVRYNFNAPFTPGMLSLFDFDGNGLKDIIARYQSGIRIYPNRSVPGFAFFDAPVDLFPGSGSFICNDFDQDGRIDIAFETEDKLRILRNQNPKGVVLAENFVLDPFSISIPYTSNISTADLNNDNKPDILMTVREADYIPILKNNSHAGVFDFELYSLYGVGTARYSQHTSQDINQDGWKDVISYYDEQIGTLSIAKNKGTAPDITLEKTDFVLDGAHPGFVEPADIDGDGNVDLIVGLTDGKFTYLKNKASAGGPISNTSFEVIETYGQTTRSSADQASIAVNDLNGDGKPEIIVANTYNYWPIDGYRLEIWQNNPTDCLDPSGVTVNFANSNATVVLPPNTTWDQFEIEYKQGNSTYWNLVYSSATFYVYSGYNYQVRVRAKCYNGYTDYYYINFSIDCVNTSNFSIGNIGANTATIGGVNDIGTLEVQYSPAGLDQWTALPQYVSQLTDLLPGTTYNVRFRGRCYTPVGFKSTQFTTLCPVLKTLSISDLAYNTATVGWTGSAGGTGALLEYSGDNANWKPVDENQILTSLIPGKQYFVRGKMTCTNAMSEFTLTSFTTPCPEATGLNVTSVTPFSARVSWTDESNTAKYTMVWSIAPDGMKTTVETSATHIDLDGLNPGTVYAVAVAPYCVSTPVFTSFSFNTVCYEPINLAASNITHTTVDLSWGDQFAPRPYAVDYSISGSNVWQTAETSSNTISLEGLRPGADYEARVHINCPVKPEPYVSVHFETHLYDETRFYPNPTTSTTTIYPSKNLIGNRFYLYDNMGRSVAHGQIFDYTVDLSNFSPGIYTLKIEGEKTMRIVRR